MTDAYGGIAFSDIDSASQQDDYGGIPFDVPSQQEQEQEGALSTIVRYAAQIPIGAAQASYYGIFTNLVNMIGQGESLDPEEIEHIKNISEREGIPFDENEYLESVQQAAASFPTIGNLIHKLEESTGLPLEAKTRGQKALEFASSATRFIPKDEPITFRGMNVALPRSVLGAGVSATSEVAKELGVPEPVADIGSFAVLKHLGGLGVGARQNIPPRESSPQSAGLEFPPPIPPESYSEFKFGKAKPSGLTERGFEGLKEPREIPETKFQQINKKLEDDFKGISDKIIAESPVGETANNLKNDPTFKQASQELLDEAQTIADGMPTPIPSDLIKNEYANATTKSIKGFALDEQEMNYLKYMKEASDRILAENVSAGELVEQYRKNNRGLSKYFEPGSSAAVNNAKRDALLDQNKAIASAMEKAYPESELVQVFKDGNARWTKIRDVETIDKFLNDVFSGKKIDYKKLHDFFDKENYGRIFKRSLGEEGFKDFEQLLKDMLTTEAPYRMLKVADKMGWTDLYKIGLTYMVKPALAPYKVGYDILKGSYKKLMNAMLDKPKLAMTFRRATQNLKKGDFKAAERDFKAVEAEGFKKQADTIRKEWATAKQHKKEQTIKSVNDIEKRLKILGLKDKINKLEKEALNLKSNGRDDLAQKRINNASELREQLEKLESSRETEVKIEEPKPKKETAKRIAKASKEPKKTKLQALQEGLKTARENLSNRKETYEMVVKSNNHPNRKQPKLPDVIVKEYKKLYNSAEKRVKDIEYEIDRLKEFEQEKVTSRSKKTPDTPKQQSEKIEAVRRQDISKEGLKSQKSFILDKLDDVLDNPGKYKGQEKILLDVPGDGVFKIHNDEKALKAFKKNIEKKWPSGPMRKPRR